jgi:DNA topoisomerase-1
MQSVCPLITAARKLHQARLGVSSVKPRSPRVLKRSTLVVSPPRRVSAPIGIESRDAAASAGLRYVTDGTPGIARQRVGKGFRYVSPDGSTVRDADELKRIRALAIPPAWTGVWICPNPRGHPQATGRDARGRKQHRYHARWRKVRDEAKYDRILDFAAALPALRRQTDDDVSLSGLSRDKVVAAVVQLLEKTLIRVGNDEYARDNQSFGLTTMRTRHARITGSQIRFRFRGKSGKFHDIAFSDARLARIAKRCQELPGRELFQYLDDNGDVQDINSSDVNDYLRRVMGLEFTAKDFRTWTGTVLAARALQEMQEFGSDTQAKKNILLAVEAVANLLGNTRSVCRKCYVHPAIIDAYLDRSLASALSARAGKRLASPHALSRLETAVLALLQRRLRRESQRKSA